MPQHTVNQRVKALLRKRDALRGKQAALRRAQRALLLELHAGAKLCEGLVFLHYSILQQQLQGSGSSASDHGAVLSQLAAEMLGEQDSSGSSGGDGGNHGGAPSASSAPGAAESSALSALQQLVIAEFEQEEPGVCMVSPAADPLAYMRRVFDHPMPPGEASATAEQLVHIYKEVVTEAGLLLHGLECETEPKQRQQGLEQLERLWDRYSHACRHSLTCDAQMYELQCHYQINLTTMERDVEGACLQASKGGQVLEQLGLTQRQRERMEAGVRLCVRQMERMNTELVRLQAQPQQQQAGGPVSRGSSSSGSGSGSPSSILEGLASSSPAAAEARRAHLAAEEQRISQLNRLLLKGTWIRMLAFFWVVGGLTWAQMSKGAAAYWPFIVRWTVVALGGI